MTTSGEEGFVKIRGYCTSTKKRLRRRTPAACTRNCAVGTALSSTVIEETDVRILGSEVHTDPPEW